MKREVRLNVKDIFFFRRQRRKAWSNEANGHVHGITIIQTSHIHFPNLKMLLSIFHFRRFLSKIPFRLKDSPIQGR